MADSKDIDALLYYLSPQRLLDHLRKIENTVYSDEELAEWRAKEQERLLNQKRRCCKCRKVFKYRELHGLNVSWHTNLYCIECLLMVMKRYTSICIDCGAEFLYRVHRTRCDQCRIYNRKAQSDVIKHHKRKSKLAGLRHDLDLYDWLYTLNHFDGKCAYCQEQPYEELEHFNPHVGTTWKNCVPACYACNQAKIGFDTGNPPVHFGTIYIDSSQLPKGINKKLFVGIKRVAAYLGVSFPYEITEEDLPLPRPK